MTRIAHQKHARRPCWTIPSAEDLSKALIEDNSTLPTNMLEGSGCVCLAIFPCPSLRQVHNHMLVSINPIIGLKICKRHFGIDFVKRSATKPAPGACSTKMSLVAVMSLNHDALRAKWRVRHP